MRRRPRRPETNHPASGWISHWGWPSKTTKAPFLSEIMQAPTPRLVIRGGNSLQWHGCFLFSALADQKVPRLTFLLQCSVLQCLFEKVQCLHLGNIQPLCSGPLHGIRQKQISENTTSPLLKSASVTKYLLHVADNSGAINKLMTTTAS